MKRISFQEAERYIKSKPFIERTGFGDVYHFNPLHHTTSNSTLEDLKIIRNKAILKIIEKDIQKESDKTLEKVIKSMTPYYNTYQIIIDTISQNNEYVDLMSMVLSDDICDLLSNGCIKNNPSLSDTLYIEYRIRQKTAKRLLNKFNLRTDDKINNNILFVYDKIKEIKDIDRLFKFGFAYSMEVTSKIYLTKLEETIEKFERLIE